MTNSGKTAPSVVVLGAGYAGVTAATLLSKRSGAAVTLINDHDRFQERMRNHQLATGQRLRDLPLRDLLKRTGIRLVIDRVTRIDLQDRQVELAVVTQRRVRRSDEAPDTEASPEVVFEAVSSLDHLKKWWPGPSAPWPGPAPFGSRAERARA